MPAFVWRTDPAGAFTYLDDRFLHWRGEDLAEHGVSDDGSFNYVDAVHPDDREGCLGLWAECLHTGLPFRSEMRLRDANDNYRWWQAEGMPHRDAAGEIKEWSGTIIDVDELKRAEAALRIRELELTRLADTVPVLIWSTLPTGEPVFINRRLCEWAGVEIGDLDDPDRTKLAAAVAQTVHPDDAPAVGAALQRSFTSGDPFAMRYRHRCADGLYRWVDGRAEALRDADGTILRWYGVSRDIEDEIRDREALRKARETLAQATQLASLSTLAASIAHEVNQPLAAIVSNAQACQRWLSADPPNVERARLVAERIADAAQSGAAVVQRIRALFRPDDKRREPLQLSALVRDAVSLMTDDFRAHGAACELSLAPELPILSGDPVQIQQVLVNLIRNALEAMDQLSEPRLELTTVRAPNHVQVCLRDFGPGAPDLSAIFEPFVTSKSGGMGMGLAICRSVAEAHGGSLSAELACPGLRMTLALPISDDCLELPAQ
jgi:PAS domain S-box-containing protein